MRRLAAMGPRLLFGIALARAHLGNAKPEVAAQLDALLAEADGKEAQ